MREYVRKHWETPNPKQYNATREEAVLIAKPQKVQHGAHQLRGRSIGIVQKRKSTNTPERVRRGQSIYQSTDRSIPK